MNHIIWADIPVKDMSRARDFYSQMLRVEIELMPGMDNVAAPRTGEGEVSFDLFVADEGRSPGQQGPTIYFDSQGDIDAMIERAGVAGGEVLQAPQDMGPVVGVIAFVKDPEGNVFGIRQQSAQG